MAVKEILMLGNPLLYQKCDDVTSEDLSAIKKVVIDMHDTLFDFRLKYGVGRAIAAPQIGILKRIVYMYIDKPVVFINPLFENMNNEIFEVWDDCMSFPNLLVRVERYKEIRVKYYDQDFNECQMELKDSIAELLQHEIDHLDGVLAVMRAKDKYSFKYNNKIMI